MTDHQHTADTLNRAADLIEERGWGTGNGAMRMDGSPLCLEGGIAAALGMEPTLLLDEVGYVVNHGELARCPAYEAVKSFLGDRCRNTVLDVQDADLWAWNDTVAQSAAEVIETLRAAAAIEQSKADAERTDSGYDSATEAKAVGRAMATALVEFR